MNFENYDRLVKHLETMPPDKFDYTEPGVSEAAGCVACQCVKLSGTHDIVGDEGTIRQWLDVSWEDAIYLWSPSDGRRDLYPNEYTGRKGIANALHRLSVVASRYTRPAILDQSSDFKERQFLLQCMETASQPIAEEVE